MQLPVKTLACNLIFLIKKALSLVEKAFFSPMIILS